MIFLDISHDTKNRYRLKKNEKAVFFMLNRAGEILFDLSETGAQAHIFSFFLLNQQEAQTLKLTQKHRARKTISRALVKAAIAGEGSLTYEGLIHIAVSGNQSEAFQESRSLLLSQESHVFTKPALEIEAPDVRCHHAATSSPLNKDSLFYLKTRGLSDESAKRLLLEGFFHEALERMEALGVDKGAAEKKLVPALAALC